MNNDIRGISGIWLRSFLATEIMNWHRDNLSWKDQNECVQVSLENWKPDENWEHFGLMLDLLPDKDWFLHIFIAEGGGWRCEAYYKDEEGITDTSSFRLVVCIAIAKAAGWK